MDIQNNLSYEVQVDGDTVIVPGTSLKAMRSKEGYYRMVYRDKLFVLHGSEIRELDRTENLDSEDDELLHNYNPAHQFGAKPPDLPGGYPSMNPHVGLATHHPSQANSSYPPYNTATTTAPVSQHPYDYQQRPQNYMESSVHLKSFDRWYDVKLHGTWIRLHQSSVTPSKERPGFYNVSYQGRINYVDGINVVPLELNATNASSQHPPNRVANYPQPPTQVMPGNVNVDNTAPTMRAQPQHVATAPEELKVQNLNIAEQRRPKIRRESYTVKEGVQEFTEKVKVFVGGEWRVYNRRELKPSKKQPGTFILKLPHKSVRLSSQHIKDIPRDSVPPIRYQYFQVFLNRTYVNLSLDDIEDAPHKPGYKVVTYNGIKQLLHQNFIFPMKEVRENELVAVIPDFFKVYLTPGGVIIPKENIKPDEEIHNTFMVLWNEVIYKVSAEQVEPVVDEREDKKAKSGSNNKDEEKKSSKACKIPIRPKGKFPNQPGAETNAVNLCKKKGAYTYRVKIDGVTNHIASHNVVRDNSKPGTYKVYHKDKWIQVEEKYVSLSTKNASRDDINSKGKIFNLTSNSPFRSPLPWDKRLRKSSLIKKNMPVRPRWRNSRSSAVSSTTTSKKLHYKKLMVPSEDENGKFEIETNPRKLAAVITNDVTVEPAGLPSSSTTTTTTTMTTKPPSPTSSTTTKPLSPTSATTGRDSVDTFADTASMVTSTTLTSTQPILPGYRERQRTCSGPGVLIDNAIMAGPDGRANMEWIKSLRC